jgi:hypothetical protein
MPDYSNERNNALMFAVESHRNDITPCDPRRVLRAANMYFCWLTAPIRLILGRGPAVDQTTGQPTNNEGDTMKDTDKAQLTVTAEDAKGQVTASGADITFTSADTTVATIVTDPDGTMWVVAGNPGSTVITADWPDSPGGDLQGTLAVDVTAGDATSLVITAGAPVPQ